MALNSSSTIEGRIILTAVNQTASTFAEIEAQIERLNKSMGTEIQAVQSNWDEFVSGFAQGMEQELRALGPAFKGTFGDFSKMLQNMDLAKELFEGFAQGLADELRKQTPDVQRAFGELMRHLDIGDAMGRGLRDFDRELEGTFDVIEDRTTRMVRGTESAFASMAQAAMKYGVQLTASIGASVAYQATTAEAFRAREVSETTLLHRYLNSPRGQLLGTWPQAKSRAGQARVGLGMPGTPLLEYVIANEMGFGGTQADIAVERFADVAAGLGGGATPGGVMQEALSARTVDQFARTLERAMPGIDIGEAVTGVKGQRERVLGRYREKWRRGIRAPIVNELLGPTQKFIGSLYEEQQRAGGSADQVKAEGKRALEAVGRYTDPANEANLAILNAVYKEIQEHPDMVALGGTFLAAVSGGQGAAWILNKFGPEAAAAYSSIEGGPSVVAPVAPVAAPTAVGAPGFGVPSVGTAVAGAAGYVRGGPAGATYAVGRAALMRTVAPAFITLRQYGLTTTLSDEQVEASAGAARQPERDALNEKLSVYQQELAEAEATFNSMTAAEQAHFQFKIDAARANVTAQKTQIEEFEKIARQGEAADLERLRAAQEAGRLRNADPTDEIFKKELGELERRLAARGVKIPPYLTRRQRAARGELERGGRWAGGSMFDLLPGAFPRAAGGAVGGGQSYMVGETGPELFVPSGAGGMIVPGTTAGLGGMDQRHFDRSVGRMSRELDRVALALLRFGLVVEDTIAKMLKATEGMAAGMGAGGAGGSNLTPFGDVNWDAVAQSISVIESGSPGGNYGALGSVTASGDRAYGRYQVMGNNVGPWTQKYFGQRLTTAEFLANPQAQDAVFKGEFGSYIQRYGMENAAQAWFGGAGSIGQGGRTDMHGTSVSSYGQRFMQGYQRYGGQVTTSGGFAGSTDMPSGLPSVPARDPMAGATNTSGAVNLGRGQVDVNVTLDPALRANQQGARAADQFDVGVNVDRTGAPFARPGDPSFVPAHGAGLY